MLGNEYKFLEGELKVIGLPQNLNEFQLVIVIKDVFLYQDIVA